MQIDFSQDYHVGYSNGFKDATIRALEGLPEMVARLQNPPPIHVDGKALLDVELAATDSQQLKPKMPTREEFFDAAQKAVTYEMNYRERLIVIGLYDFISRHFGR